MIEQLGLRVKRMTGDSGVDFVTADGAAIEVKTSARPGLSWLRRVTRDQPTVPTTGGGEAGWREFLPVLVADHIDPGMRRELDRLGWGWLDRSGHLRLVHGSLQIDRQIPSLSGPDVSAIDPLSRPTGRAVAVQLLEGTGTESIRQLAGPAGVSTGAAHAAVSELRELGLLDADGRRDPDLFWALAAHWSARWYALGDDPVPVLPETVRRLVRFGLNKSTRPGWAEVGDRIARAYGVRLVAEETRKFYVPDQRALTWALRTWEAADDDRRAVARLAVPPTPTVTSQRVDLGNEFMAARPIVVALDLAADGSPRSREVLDDWDGIPTRQPRVW